MSRFIFETMHLEGDRSRASVTRDLVTRVLMAAESIGGMQGDVRIRFDFDKAYLADRVIVTWDEVGE